MPGESQKPVWWKILVGLVLLYVEIKNHFSQAPNLMKARDPAEQLGMNIAMGFFIALGCWLLYSGIKPVWRKTL